MLCSRETLPESPALRGGGWPVQLVLLLLQNDQWAWAAKVLGVCGGRGAGLEAPSQRPEKRGRKTASGRAQWEPSQSGWASEDGRLGDA